MSAREAGRRPPLKPPDDGNEAAAYIAAMATELATIARRNAFHTLAHLLEMVQLEAHGIMLGHGSE